MNRFLKFTMDPTLLDIDNSLNEARQLKDENNKYLQLANVYKRYGNYWAIGLTEHIISSLSAEEIIFYANKSNLYDELSKMYLDKFSEISN